MNLIWNLDGIKVMSVTTNRWDGMQMCTSGFAMKGDEPIGWDASVNSQGWFIEITRSTGKIGSYQGNTYNLPLEISAAIRRLA